MTCQVQSATLVLLLMGGAAGCERTASLEPLSPQSSRATGDSNSEMSALLATIQREFRGQGPADPQREQLVEALAAARRGTEPSPTAGVVPLRVEQALNQLLASPGDSATAVRVLEALARPDNREP